MQAPYAIGMSEITGAIIGALSIICIPLIAWFSRRATPEGRLILRVERLGRLYALMPESEEKESFKPRLTEAVGNLNAWLDPHARSGRRIIQAVAVSVYLVGVVAAMLVINSVGEDVKSWVSPLLGVCLGMTISGITIVTAQLVARTVQRKILAAAMASEEEASALRMDALRRGAPISDAANGSF